MSAPPPWQWLSQSALAPHDRARRLLLLLVFLLVLLAAMCGEL